MQLNQNQILRMTRRADAQPLAEAARGGFTFVELLMVLCVLVVLTSMALPTVLRWQRGMPMEQAISTLQLQLQETRLAAIRSGETWLMVLPQNRTLGRRHPADNANVTDLKLQFAFPTEIQCQDESKDANVSPIACHPDGTVSDRRLRLIDAGGRVTILQIDRLTGTASVDLLKTALREPQGASCGYQSVVVGRTVRSEFRHNQTSPELAMLARVYVVHLASVFHPRLGPCGSTEAGEGGCSC